MLRLKNITKSYTTAGFTQNAMDGVSVAFRDNEFAAVLGPSGSGKTTMLNIIGGLDRYDSGDLEIDGISTENYKAHDWDTYRNNRIGFVFQSYNLIPHQSILANVEIALTLSGVGKRERRRRAKEALAEVDLSDHMRKKPGQLSGGQMQRVAIARALVNDPEILLADEPTGALDTTTSKQVLELLTEIAKDRLVIMVTHNNELAQQYANRIIHLTDGRVTSDDRPFDPDEEPEREARSARRAGMSFLTAVALSFSNLMTKKGRTFTTAFAGSIGIIGIATILAFSNGINNYIKTMEEETLSIYPLSIQEQGFNLSMFFGADENEDQASIRGNRPERPPNTVREIQIMETVFSTQRINDLASFKLYLDENSRELDQYVSAVHYLYDITPNIYLPDTSKGIEQINPDSIFSAMMGGADMAASGGMSFMPSMQIFNELPSNPVLYDTQYDLLAGYWPEKHDEAVLVLAFGNRVMDFTLYSLGIRDRDEMRAMLESVMQRSDIGIELSESKGFYEYDELMVSFKVIIPAQTYQYDETFDVWIDKSTDESYMKELIANSLDLKIVGIVAPNQDATSTVLSVGVNYTPALINYLIESAAETPIVKQQLENPDMNIITGKTFREERENRQSSFDFSKVFSVDEDAIRSAMNMESLFDALNFDGMEGGFSLDGGIDLGGFDFSGMDIGNIDFSGIDFGGFDLGGLSLDIDMAAMPPPELDIGALAMVIASEVNIPPDALSNIMTGVMGGFFSSMDIPSVFSSPNPAGGMTEAFNAYLESPQVQAAVMAELANYIDPSALEAEIAAAVQGFMMISMQEYMQQMMTMIEMQMAAATQSAADQIQASVQASIRQMTNQMTNQMTRQIERAMQGVSEQIEESIAGVFNDMAAQMEAAMGDFDAEALAEAFTIEFSEEMIYELMTSVMNQTTTSFDGNMTLFGYAEIASPMQIRLYPRSFEAKQEILDTLERYNKNMEDAGEEEKVIHFTDIVGLMMSTVTDIIDIVSYALISFVSVALVVSSIMIGVITFVSVLERKKEIGILRAVGASKANIKQVFNAETLIIGFTAGVIGVLVTFFIAFVANIILDNALGINNLVIMPPTVPLLLVAISMFLTFIAGLIPASAAARKPPVDALRSE
ncbi:MAG: ATP-binding cassette domain-containing protein [Oscillospiraceae bacterium]|nr:ATP-binding cassette domain-containing protein [Oscillospiraceae bacterium]